MRLLLSLVSAPLWAQTALSLAEAIATAAGTHPLVAAAGASIEAAQSARLQAALRPNPRLTLQHENIRSYSGRAAGYLDSTDTFAFLQNTFETNGKRDRRVELAEIARRRADLDRELLRKHIGARVASAYWAAAGAAFTLTLLEESVSNLQQTVDYHENRLRLGSIAEADALRVRLEAQRVRLAANTARLDSDRARIHLFREMGQSNFPAVVFSSRLDQEPAVANVDAGAALDLRVEVRIGRLNIEAARAAHRLQTALSRPNVEVLFGYKRTAGLDTVLGGIQTDLTLFNRNQGNIGAAAAQIRVAESALAAAEALVRAEVQAASAEFEMRRRELARSVRPLLDQSEETYRIAEAAYREGGADLLRLLDAQRVRIEARLTHARALTELWQSHAALETALGVER